MKVFLFFLITLYRPSVGSFSCTASTPFFLTCGYSLMVVIIFLIMFLGTHEFDNRPLLNQLINSLTDNEMRGEITKCYFYRTLSINEWLLIQIPQCFLDFCKLIKRKLLQLKYFFAQTFLKWNLLYQSKQLNSICVRWVFQICKKKFFKI